MATVATRSAACQRVQPVLAPVGVPAADDLPGPPPECGRPRLGSGQRQTAPQPACGRLRTPGGHVGRGVAAVAVGLIPPRCQDSPDHVTGTREPLQGLRSGMWPLQLSRCTPSSQPAWPLQRASLPFETSFPALVGDVRYGSVKRVAGAAGEGSVAVGSVHQYLQDFDRTRHRQRTRVAGIDPRQASIIARAAAQLSRVGSAAQLGEELGRSASCCWTMGRSGVELGLRQSRGLHQMSEDACRWDLLPAWTNASRGAGPRREANRDGRAHVSGVGEDLRVRPWTCCACRVDPDGSRGRSRIGQAVATVSNAARSSAASRP
jgi:hypothetical protein